MCTGERQAGRIRHLYLKAILRQDIGFFDKEASTGDVIGRLSGDVVLIQAAIGEKVGNFTYLLSKFMESFGVAFYRGWKLTVVMISATPLLVAVGSITSIVASKLSIGGQQAYIEAGNVVEQTLLTIKTVASLAGEKKAVLTYKKALAGAYKATLRQGLATESYCFAIASGRLVKRLRALTFEKVMHREMGWFDEIQNFSDAIGARLSTDAANVRAMVGDALSLAVQNTATIIAAIVIAFTETWELSLLILALMPFIGIQVCLQVKFMKVFRAEIKTMYQGASQVANEAARNIRTVASFGAEDRVMDIYSRKCTVCLQSGINKGISGIVLGLSNLMVFGVYALNFWVGAHLFNDGKTTFIKPFTVYNTLSVHV